MKATNLSGVSLKLGAFDDEEMAALKRLAKKMASRRVFGITFDTEDGITASFSVVRDESEKVFDAFVGSVDLEAE